MQPPPIYIDFTIKNIQLALDEKKKSFVCIHKDLEKKMNSLSLFEYHLMHLN